MKSDTLGKAQTSGWLSTSTVVPVALIAWLAVAFAVAATGVLEDPPTPLPPILILGPVLLFLIAFRRSQGLRKWTFALNLRWPILYHVVRVGVGAGFLVMSGEELPSEFAVPAGFGDIGVGAAALMAAFYVPARTALRRRLLFAWNLAGLLDMLMVFVTAQRLILFGDDPEALVQLTKFPLLVIPMFIVPMVLITHFAIFAKLWDTRAR